MQKLHSGGGSPYANHLTTPSRQFDSPSSVISAKTLIWHKSSCLVWAGRAVWLEDYRYAQQECESCSGMLAPPRNSQLYCSSRPTFISPIATHNNLHPENHPSFPPRCGLRLVERSQHGRLRLADSARERELWKDRPRFKAGRKIMGVVVLCGIMFIWNMILFFYSDLFTNWCAYNLVLKVKEFVFIALWLNIKMM